MPIAYEAKKLFITIKLKTKTMKITIISAILMAFLTLQTAFINQDKQPKVKTESFEVSGCCGQCKDRIENALDIKGVRLATWDKHTKVLTVTYKTKLVNADKILQIVAAVGHDNEKYTATEEAYSKLPGCCQYRGGSKCTH